MTGRPIDTRLALAKARSEAARARLSSTIGQLQVRARPKSLVQDVTATLKERGTHVVVGIVDTARSKPARTGAVLALAGLFLARHRLMGLVRRATASSARLTAKSRTKGPDA